MALSAPLSTCSPRSALSEWKVPQMNKSDKVGLLVFVYGIADVGWEIKSCRLEKSCLPHPDTVDVYKRSEFMSNKSIDGAGDGGVCRVTDDISGSAHLDHAGPSRVTNPYSSLPC